MDTEITSKELYFKLQPSFTWSETAQLTEDGLNVNLSGFYTKLIKEAAKCDKFSSDIIYDINLINERMKEYRGEEFDPIWIAFRKLGVDSTSYVLTRMKDYESPYECFNNEYFKVYCIYVLKTTYDGLYRIVFSEYLT